MAVREPLDHAEAREAIVDAGRRLAARGLVIGTSGNLSVRAGDEIVVTPTGVALDALDVGHLSVVTMTGNRVSGPPPTSEVPLHLAVYAATGAGAIAHAHAVASTAVSCTCEGLPALHYNVMLLGGPPRTARYATFGTDALAVNVVEALVDGRTAALMQNHGSITYGADLGQACDRLELLEWLCELHLGAYRLGAPRVLTTDELEAVATAFGVSARRGRSAAG